MIFVHLFYPDFEGLMTRTFLLLKIVAWAWNVLSEHFKVYVFTKKIIFLKFVTQSWNPRSKKNLDILIWNGSFIILNHKFKKILTITITLHCIKMNPARFCIVRNMSFCKSQLLFELHIPNLLHFALSVENVKLLFIYFSFVPSVKDFEIRTIYILEIKWPYASCGVKII